MPRHSISRSMGYTARQLFDIAADVDNYRKFVPLVRESRRFDVQAGEGGKTSYKGELLIRYSKLGISERLVSDVVADRENLTVTSRSSQGPADHLESVWKFTDIPGGGCEVELNIDYKLKRRAIQFLVSGMFDMMVRKIHSAFESRARALYGPPSTSQRTSAA